MSGGWFAGDCCYFFNCCRNRLAVESRPGCEFCDEALTCPDRWLVDAQLLLPLPGLWTWCVCMATNRPLLLQGSAQGKAHSPTSVPRTSSAARQLRQPAQQQVQQKM